MVLHIQLKVIHLQLKKRCYKQEPDKRETVRKKYLIFPYNNYKLIQFLIRRLNHSRAKTTVRIKRL